MMGDAGVKKKTAKDAKENAQSTPGRGSIKRKGNPLARHLPNDYGQTTVSRSRSKKKKLQNPTILGTKLVPPSLGHISQPHQPPLVQLLQLVRS
ncbi:hypothetical protein JTB14_035270 [Gonioctena quinquepunctata]|nr:hypothetical protein JTB14_035270 [Gonioctena quinquepunctata]